MEETSPESRAELAKLVEAEKHEIEVHKWIESEKAGRDLGNEAVKDWIDKHAAEFREKWNREHS